MRIGKESLLANVAEAARFETRRDLDKIGKPVEPRRVRMSPPTVNAYYDPSLNEMVFPGRHHAVALLSRRTRRSRRTSAGWAW